MKKLAKSRNWSQMAVNQKKNLVVRLFNNDILEPIQVDGKTMVVRLFSNDILEPIQVEEKSLVVRLFSNDILEPV